MIGVGEEIYLSNFFAEDVFSLFFLKTRQHLHRQLSNADANFNGCCIKVCTPPFWKWGGGREEGVNFHTKNKLKSEIFNDKKSL